GIKHISNYPYVSYANDYISFYKNIQDLFYKKIDYRKIDDFLKTCTWETRFNSLLSIVRNKSNFMKLYEQ
ncbi:MAG: hypothetical protein ABRQ39_29725, partial [Candidatus Eremiobacterota bacterium]